jgi:hypothetical protein
VVLLPTRVREDHFMSGGLKVKHLIGIREERGPLMEMLCHENGEVGEIGNDWGVKNG